MVNSRRVSSLDGEGVILPCACHHGPSIFLVASKGRGVKSRFPGGGCLAAIAGRVGDCAKGLGGLVTCEDLVGRGWPWVPKCGRFTAVPALKERPWD